MLWEPAWRRMECVFQKSRLVIIDRNVCIYNRFHSRLIMLSEFLKSLDWISNKSGNKLNMSPWYRVIKCTWLHFIHFFIIKITISWCEPNHRFVYTIFTSVLSYFHSFSLINWITSLASFVQYLDFRESLVYILLIAINISFQHKLLINNYVLTSRC